MRSEAERVTVDFAFGECCTMSPCHRQAGIPQTRFRKVPSHSSLAQSVERVTVNHDVAGSSPAGGANQKQTVIDGLFLVLFYSDRLVPDDEGFAMFAASAKRNTERCSVRQTCASLCGIFETLASGEGFTLR